MGLTKRDDSYYVEFPVKDDGRVLTLAPGGKVKRWKVGSLDKREAVKQEAIIRTKLLSGGFESAHVARSNSMTFDRWATTYLALESVMRLRSYAQRKVYVENLRQFFAGRALVSLTTEDVRAYRTYRSQHASIQTVNHCHAALGHMLSIACSPEFRLLDKNVAALVEKPNPRNERNRVATPEEWDALRRHGAEHLVRALTVAIEVGPRRGELLGLEWKDVDMHRREFTLRRTKTGEPRVVPMTAPVFDAFEACRQERRLDTQHVFLYEGKPIKSMRRAFATACRKAGITPGRAGLTMHDLRHTAATRMRRAGVDLFTAMAIVGHKSENMHRRYNTITPDDLRAAASLLDARADNGRVPQVQPGVAVS